MRRGEKRYSFLKISRGKTKPFSSFSRGKKTIPLLFKEGLGVVNLRQT
jgi:hypothetical protein